MTVTVDGDGPGALRGRAVELLLATVRADIGFFYTLYERDGARYMGDPVTMGPSAASLPVARVVGGPTPPGSAGSLRGGRAWRRGSWDVTMPLRRQRNHFLRLEDDLDREQFTRTRVWPLFYAPSEIDDHVRALVYDADDFVGWIGLFRQGRGARFTARERAALEARMKDVRALLVGAAGHRAGPESRGPAYAVLDATGRARHASATARPFLTRRRVDALRELVLRMDRGLVAPPPEVFVDGASARVVRMDADDGVRYLAVLDRAGVVRRSPLSRLSPRQRAVAELAAVGATSAEIATTLGIRPNTVKYHLKHVYEALGIESRAELARIWEREAG